jgi:hypothetical protein
MFLRLTVCACLVVMALSTTVSSFAQLTEATLMGVVTDTAARVVIASPVIARSESTGQSRSTVTDEDGAFTLPGLPPGDYTVSVTSPASRLLSRRRSG